jgi:hypothetical protein
MKIQAGSCQVTHVQAFADFDTAIAISPVYLKDEAPVFVPFSVVDSFRSVLHYTVLLML